MGQSLDRSGDQLIISLDIVDVTNNLASNYKITKPVISSSMTDMSVNSITTTSSL